MTGVSLQTNASQEGRAAAGQDRQVDRSASSQGFSGLLDQLAQKTWGRKPDVRSDIQSAVQESAEKYGVDPALVLAVIKQESGFKPQAVSPCGAQGLMQLMPATGKAMGVKNPFDIRQNVDGGTKYLSQMLDQFGGDVKLALAGYNAGPHRVVQYGGIPPYAETQNYVKSITADYQGLQKTKNYDQAFAMVSPTMDMTELNPMKFQKSGSDDLPPPPPPGYFRV